MINRRQSVLAVLCLFILPACAARPSKPTRPLADLLPMNREDAAIVQAKRLGPPANSVCDVEPGGRAMLIRGNILAPYEVYAGGEVLVGEDGLIACVGPDCSSHPSAAGATVVTCVEGVVSPGLINAHDHITWDQAYPADWGNERYDQRNDWRKGLRGHTKIPSTPDSDPKVVSWTELRQVFSGTTSIASSGGVPGLLRNLNTDAALEEGLQPRTVDNEVFPLGDGEGTQLETTCGYPKIVGPEVLNYDCFNPHVSEGVDEVAHNEFLCLSGQQAGGVDLTSPKSSFIHNIGLRPDDGKILKDTFTTVVWSPRSNISLYGNTAQVTLYDHLGIWNIALSTDWTPSGSMSLLRELKCADYFNRNHLDSHFTDYQLWTMVTANPAVGLAVADQIGYLRPGYLGDIAIYNGAGAPNVYRAVIDAEAKDAVLVLRAGMPLFGDKDVMDALPSGQAGCEEIPGGVCAQAKVACIERETGWDYATLAAANRSSYPLFFCGTPKNEPTCAPLRPKDKWGCGNYPLDDPRNDRDGDGVTDDSDNCPNIFNPVRPLDGYYAEDPYACKQADYDHDRIGDVCDVSPLGY